MNHAESKALSEMNEYTCEHCGGTFTSGWSHEEALAEAKQDPFGFQTPPPGDDEVALVCDECFEALKAYVLAHGTVENALACACRSDQPCDRAV